MQSVMREDAFALQVGNEFRVLPSRQKLKPTHHSNRNLVTRFSHS